MSFKAENVVDCLTCGVMFPVTFVFEGADTLQDIVEPVTTTADCGDGHVHEYTWEGWESHDDS
jgi:hypothetical protein